MAANADVLLQRDAVEERVGGPMFYFIKRKGGKVIRVKRNSLRVNFGPLGRVESFWKRQLQWGFPALVRALLVLGIAG